MADTGWLSPGTCSDTGTTWANPSNASALDGSSTVATVTGWLVGTSILRLSNFGASIPAGMVVTKVEVTVTGSQTLSSGITTTTYGDIVPAKDVSANPSSGGTKKIGEVISVVGDMTTATSDGVAITSWSASDWNSPTFGFRIQAPTTTDNATTGGTVTTSIDQFLVRLTYDVAPVAVGSNNPTTSASALGTTSWANPNNANASDNVYTTQTVSTTAANMPYLMCTGYGFNIPTNSTIFGITATVEKFRNGGSTGNVRDLTVQLLKEGFGLVGTNKAVTATNWGTTKATSTYGGSADLWGTTWTAAEINSADFGVAFRAVSNGTGANRVANIDSIRVSVVYAPPAGTAPTIVQKAINSGSTTTLPSATTAGNTLLVIATFDPSGTGSVADNKGNTVSSAFLDYGTSVTKYKGWLIPITTGGASHSVIGSFSSYSDFATISVYELSGTVTVDTPVTASAYDTTSPYQVTSGYPSQTNNLLFAILASEGSDNVTFSATGWTKQNELADFSTLWGQANFTKLGSSGAELFSATMSANSPEIVSVFGLKGGAPLVNPVDSGSLGVSSSGAIGLTPSLRKGAVVGVSSSASVAVASGVIRTTQLSLNGIGSVAVSGGLQQFSSVGLSAAGTIDVVGTKLINGQVGVNGAGSVNAAAMLLMGSSIGITGTASVSVVGANYLSAVVGVSGSSSVDVLGRLAISSVVGVQGAGDVQLVASVLRNATIDIGSTGSVTIAAGGKVDSGAIGVMAAAQVAALGALAMNSAVAVQAAWQIESTASVVRNAAVSVNAQGAISTTPGVVRNSAVNVSGSANVASGGGLRFTSSVDVQGTATVNVDAQRLINTSLTIAATSAVEAKASMLWAAIASVQSTAAVDTTGNLLLDSGSVEVAGQADVTAEFWRLINANVSVFAEGTIAALGKLVGSFSPNDIINVHVLPNGSINVVVLSNPELPVYVISNGVINVKT